MHFKRALKTLALNHNRLTGLYKSICRPDGTEWAEYLRRWGNLHSMGRGVSIQRNVTITDPQYVALGNNVRLSGCTLFGHDGSVNMVNEAFGANLDRVGKVVLRDNVFIGHQAIVLCGVTIGPNCIVGAGAVVATDLAPNGVYAGNPARRVSDLDGHVSRLTSVNTRYPWAEVIQRRGPVFDPQVQPELDRLRVQAFFGALDEAPPATGSSARPARRAAPVAARVRRLRQVMPSPRAAMVAAAAFAVGALGVPSPFFNDAGRDDAARAAAVDRPAPSRADGSHDLLHATHRALAPNHPPDRSL